MTSRNLLMKLSEMCEHCQRNNVAYWQRNILFTDVKNESPQSPFVLLVIYPPGELSNSLETDFFCIYILILN